MVMDDGVTARLGPEHYLMHTTTGNAAPVMAHLEEYLQTEWPELKVFLTSVTEQWATVQLAGPKARVLLQEVAPHLNLSPNALPHMSVIEGEVLGAEARVFRISFTGMEGLVSKTNDFGGKRSLYRSDMAKTDRKQLVGLLTEDPAEVLPEGAQLIDETTRTVAFPKEPVPLIGHVTSSYWSPNLGRSIALALVKGGRARLGGRVVAPLADGKLVGCTVTDPVFFDMQV